MYILICICETCFERSLKFAMEVVAQNRCTGNWLDYISTEIDCVGQMACPKSDCSKQVLLYVTFYPV